jgi:hypothetical protein
VRQKDDELRRCKTKVSIKNIKLPWNEWQMNWNCITFLQRCNLTLARGKWISWRASKRFILLARLGNFPYHKKTGHL